MEKIVKVYGVFNKGDIDDLLTSGTFNRRRMSWYNEVIKETLIGNCHMPIEQMRPIGRNDTLSFQLYLEDAKRIRRLYNDRYEIISIDIPEEIVRNNYFLTEIYWSSPQEVYSIYNVDLPYSVVEEQRNTIKKLDHSIINIDDDPEGIYEYPTVLRDNLTYRTTFHRFATIEYFFAALAKCTGEENMGTYYGTILGSLCLPSIEYFLKNNLGKSIFERSDSAFKILQKALSNMSLYYDHHRSVKSYEKEYIRLRNHTLLYPTDTLFYHLLTELIETYGDKDTFENLYWRVNKNSASKKELKDLLIEAAQASFNTIYDYQNGILIRKSDNVAMDVEKRRVLTKKD